MRRYKSSKPMSGNTKRWNPKRDSYFEKYDISFYESLCARRYYKEEWYGKEVVGGWPGVRGPVYLGWPVVDRFGDVIVVIQDEHGYIKSQFLGKPKLRK